MAAISEVKNHLTGLGGAASIDDVVNLYALLERASHTMLAKIDPIETERVAALSSLVYDDVYNYSLPSDYKKIIDLYPQEQRESLDRVSRKFAEPFDAQKLIKNKQITIESSEGTKFIRINWRKGGANEPKTLHSMNSLTANGTWSAVASASGLKAQKLYKVKGNASIEFDVSATGDGIQNTGMTALDLTNEDELADVFVWLYIPTSADLANFNSTTIRWGNDLTANYWQSAAVSAQADGSVLKVGWNLLKFTWSGATETGTVVPSAIDSFRIVVNIVAAIGNLKVDEIIFAVGRNYDLKYYSQYSFKNSAGTFIAQPTTDNDTMIHTGLAYQIFLLESRIAIAQQLIKDPRLAVSATSWERLQLNGDPTATDRALRIGLYAYYRSEYPSMSKKATTSYAGLPRFLLRRIHG